jgi:hypothetical protein
MNNYESAAMWKLYTRTNEAVAFQSTYRRLRDCMPGDVLIGEVQYIDYETDTIPETNLLYPFLYKRKSFAHEREIRAIIFEVSHNEKGIDFVANTVEGKYVPVDLDMLIERIYVAPTAPKWFMELVRSVAERYALHKEVVHSSLDSEPLF